MKKAIGAFVSGLLLSGVVAAIFGAVKKQRVEGESQAPQDQPREVEQRSRRPERRQRRRQAQPSGLLDLNSCSREELGRLEGLDDELIGKVIDNRPYRNKLDLMSRMVIPEATYVLISHHVTASEPGESVKVAS
jgi:DNA uptake protein ComE-like DNA-binding protein